jgi:hypothetical protein
MGTSVIFEKRIMCFGKASRVLLLFNSILIQAQAQI